jgi:cytochrome bd ubiquinol oxidase subunit II
VHLGDVTMVVILVGLALYVVLAGADFGAAVWQAAAGRSPQADALREHAHESMSPVWEANHVWLIFVLTVLWTAFPEALGSIASTLGVALFAAGLGIIVRGAAYALRTGISTPAALRRIDALSAISSVLTPFALGAAIGGIASGRVPVGNASGDLFASWLNPTSIAIGVLSVVTSVYLAAVFLAADAGRRGDAALARAYRLRALGVGAVAGAIAVAGLIVLRSDARGLFDALLTGDGLPGVIVSVLAGLATLGLLASGRGEPARYTAALAVAAIIAGWALAQNPVILPHLTIRQAAAPHDTLVAVLVAVGAGGALLFPSLALLFGLTLGGHLQPGAGASPAPPGGRGLLAASRAGMLGRAAVACLIAGIGLLTIAEGSWPHAVGVVALLGFLVLGFLAAVPGLLEPGQAAGGRPGR